jgi:hypothetical protein
MVKIDTTPARQTVITTFECSPGTCADLMDKLQGAYRDFISQQPASSPRVCTLTTRRRG